MAGVSLFWIAYKHIIILHCVRPVYCAEIVTYTFCKYISRSFIAFAAYSDPKPACLGQCGRVISDPAVPQRIFSSGRSSSSRQTAVGHSIAAIENKFSDVVSALVSSRGNPLIPKPYFLIKGEAARLRRRLTSRLENGKTSRGAHG